MKLTPTEEQIMKLLWKFGKSTVSSLIEKIPGEKPPHSTISSVVRILEKKGFVDHETYGRTHAYFPKISKKRYSQSTLTAHVKNYFDGSVENMLSFLVKENNIDPNELKKMLHAIEQKSASKK